MGTTTIQAGSAPDLRLGRIAVRRGWVTPEQVERALAEQAGGAGGRIGEILVARGNLTDTGLALLLQEQEAARASPAEGSLGRILVDRVYVTARQLERCLRAQAEAPPPAPMLGDLLVRMGLVTPAEVAEALALQKKTILSCRSCGRRANATAFNPGASYGCPECGGELVPLPVLDDIRVSGPSLPAALAARKQADAFELGKYTVVRILGKGGMGVVFEAIDTTLNRRVALKMLVDDPEAADPQGDEQRFLREARLWARLPKHPHVVGVYEAGVIDGRRYLAMEFIEGVSFAQWRKQGTVSVARQVEVLRDAALAAHHAHEQGIVHRDLKPDNVLVDASGRPHLTDFGLAVPADRGSSASITDTGSVVGTPGYMSPEQARGESRLDRRSDVYALGVMLFEILAGRVPFQGPSSVDVMVRIMTEPVPAPSAVALAPIEAPNVPELERVCLRATAKDPAARQATSREFAEDLARWLDGDARPRRRRW